jgi:hypothetical protein
MVNVKKMMKKATLVRSEQMRKTRDSSPINRNQNPIKQR